MNVKTTVFILSAAAVLSLSGCNTTKEPSASSIRHYQQNTIDASHSRARLVLGSADLVDRVAMVDVRMGKVGELVRAEISVQNLSNDRYTLEYMIRWEDSQGFGINDNPVWKRFVLGPRQIRSFQSVTGNPDGYALTMTVRLPDDVFIQQEKMKQ